MGGEEEGQGKGQEEERQDRGQEQARWEMVQGEEVQGKGLARDKEQEQGEWDIVDKQQVNERMGRGMEQRNREEGYTLFGGDTYKKKKKLEKGGG